MSWKDVASAKDYARKPLPPRERIRLLERYRSAGFPVVDGIDYGFRETDFEKWNRLLAGDPSMVRRLQD